MVDVPVVIGVITQAEHHRGIPLGMEKTWRQDSPAFTRDGTRSKFRTREPVTARVSRSGRLRPIPEFKISRRLVRDSHADARSVDQFHVTILPGDPMIVILQSGSS